MVRVIKFWKHLYVSVTVFWKGKAGKGGLKSLQPEFPGRGAETLAAETLLFI